MAYLRHLQFINDQPAPAPLGAVISKVSRGSKECLQPWTRPSPDDLDWIPEATDDNNIEIPQFALAPAISVAFGRRGTFGPLSNQPPSLLVPQEAIILSNAPLQTDGDNLSLGEEAAVETQQLEAGAAEPKHLPGAKNGYQELQSPFPETPINSRRHYLSIQSKLQK